MKPNKSILKRIKVTGTGKFIHRTAGQNHFNAKESGRTQRRKGALKRFPRAFNREIRIRV